MAANTFSTIRYEQPYAADGPGTVSYTHGPEPFFRDGLDADRSRWNTIPGADYPDGYLGTIRSRRDDRLLDRLKNRQNQRSYQRGVHKGEMVDRADYFWPANFTPMTGLERQATTGLRFAPQGMVESVMGPNPRTPAPRGAEGIIEMNDRRGSQLAHLSPSWR